ncbi:hypothetical protein GBN33_03125 [Plesiomonas shigelloides]|uniref:hypothetical protein n=1 Tax=Plesiomonas shigelloides TaxID=703 RepID=UPI0012623DE8|nr:hypothetical protein [Plesiomonas shigelloides]KAB7702106.1 hypothetical protein GBN33_03125 [Plesiomonas shigelloides]
MADNNKFKQGHFEMGIRYANFTPISNRCARKRATLCPLTKCYHEFNKHRPQLSAMEIALMHARS